MQTSFVLIIHGPDRPGLVGALADAISSHSGSWMESRMANLSGQFAGILRVECPASAKDSLVDDLEKLAEQGIHVQLAGEPVRDDSRGESVVITITGHDEPGIVKTIASVLAAQSVNVEELKTSLESAPMSGHSLFCTKGEVRLPEGLEITDLINALEEVGSDLTVDVN